MRFLARRHVTLNDHLTGHLHLAPEEVGEYCSAGVMPIGLHRAAPLMEQGLKLLAADTIAPARTCHPDLQTAPADAA